MLLVSTPDAVDSVNRLFITNVTSECIARVSRIGYQPSRLDNLDDPGHAVRLRVSWVNFDKFGHARIVGN